MDARTRQNVRSRAGNRCEYCHIHQQHYVIRFHIEHVTPRQHHGNDDASNLALACHHCNRHKGPNLSGIDPSTGTLTRLFNPRTDDWSEHFTASRGNIFGLTDVGRTTVYVLAMNDPNRIQARLELEPQLFGGT